MIIEDKKVVSVQFTVKNVKTSEIIETSDGGEPLVYLHGFQNLVPGLERALTGKKVGENYEVTVQPEEGYGERDETLVQQVPRDAFQGIDNIKLGMEFQAESPNGPVVVEVVAVDDDTITVDSNHPLAGVTLAFSGTIQDIREATETELEHGHVHGEDGEH